MKEICVRADTDNIGEVFDFVEGELAQNAGVERDDLFKIHMIVDEIFSNIANYAYDDDKGDVSVSYSYDPGIGEITIVFSDDGRPYNPLENQDPDVTLPAGKRRIGGLGIFMVKNTADRIRYENRDGKNIVTLIIRTGGDHAGD